MKIRCPQGGVKSPEECLACANCYPLPIKRSLLADQRTQKKRDGKPRFGVTRLVADCLRKSYYDLTEELVYPLEKLWIFSRGKAIHTFFQQDLEDFEKEIYVEKDFPSFTVLGFIDAVHDGVIYEFKTTADIPEVPQEHHILQAQSYFSLLLPEEQAKIKKILIVYISLQKIRSFEIPKRDILRWIEAQGTILSTALIGKTLPSKQESWLCQHCEYKELCSQNKQSNKNAEPNSLSQTTLL